MHVTLASVLVAVATWQRNPRSIADYKERQAGIAAAQESGMEA